MKIEVSRAVVMIMRYGQDVVLLETPHIDPFAEEDTLDLQFRAPRMKGEAYVRKTFPGVPVLVREYSEGFLDRA